MSSQNSNPDKLSLSNVRLLSDKFDKMLFSLTKNQFDLLPSDCSKKIQTKFGRTYYSMSVKVVESEIDPLVKHSFDIDLCFVEFKFNGKTGRSIYGKLVKDNGILPSESYTMAQKLLS
jgi:hypothetical protein